MHLYYQWERYLVTKDKANKNIRWAIVEILTAINELKPPRDKIDEIFPTSFTPKKNTMSALGIGEDFWPNLNKILSMTRIDTNNRVFETPAKSHKIFREALFYLSRVEWVYTNDISYENVLRKQFWYKAIEEWVKQPLLIPSFFEHKNTETCITLEVCQDEDICFLERKL